VAEEALEGVGGRLEIPKLAKKARLRRVIVAAVLVAAGVVAYVMWPTAGLGERYRTTTVTRRTIIKVVEATGHVDVRRRVEVPAPIPGRLVEILVYDRAAALAVRGAQATVQAAAGRVAEARAALSATTEERQRVERLVGRGLASQQDLSSARAAEQRAQAALTAARAEQQAAAGTVASAQLGRNLGDIVAPSDGVVLVAPERLGAAVGPERGALFVIGDALDVMRIDAQVGEADIGDVRIGQSTTFEVQAFPGRTFHAKVDRVGLEPSRAEGLVTYPVTLLAANPGGVLLPGMTATVRLEVARREGVLAVREAALRWSPADAARVPPRSRVWRWTKRSTIEPVLVLVGISDGQYTEVMDARDARLQEGDRIALGLRSPGAASSGAGRPGISLGGKR
jgi:HlyD family secretion protein